MSLRRGRNLVLDGVDLCLPVGRSLAVVGPSGAGKSSLLRLLAGLLLPTSGTLRLNGEAQTYLRGDQQHPVDVRLVFQSPALLASLSVAENVGFLLRRSRVLSPAEVRERVERALAAVGLHDIADLYPGQLSGGMQKRVSFARAVIDDPEVAGTLPPLLLFDEPTAGLDPVAATRIEDLIVETTQLTRGTSLVVSHVLSTVRRAADTIALLYDGAISWSGSVDAFDSTDNPYVVQFRTGSLQGPMQTMQV